MRFGLKAETKSFALDPVAWYVEVRWCVVIAEPLGCRGEDMLAMCDSSLGRCLEPNVMRLLSC